MVAPRFVGLLVRSAIATHASSPKVSQRSSLLKLSVDLQAQFGAPGPIISGGVTFLRSDDLGRNWSPQPIKIAKHYSVLAITCS
jgi:hypothetical protein